MKPGSNLLGTTDITTIASPSHPIKVSEINANIFSAFYDVIYNAAASLGNALVSLRDFVEVGNWVLSSLKVPEVRAQVAFFSLQLILTLIVALFLAKGVAYLLRSRVHTLLDCAQAPAFEKVKKLGFATFLSVLTPFIFGFSFYTLSRVISPHNALYLAIARILTSGAVDIWVLLNLAHLFLRPPSAQHQHLPLPRHVLKSTYTWVRRIAIVALTGFFTLEIGQLINLPAAGQKLLLQSSGVIIAIMAMVMMRNLHKEIKVWIKIQRQQKKLSPLKRALLPYLNYSYLPLLVFIIVSYVSWTTHSIDSTLVTVWKGLLTLAIFPAVRLLAFCVRKIRILYVYGYILEFLPFVGKYVFAWGRRLDLIVLVGLNVCALLFVLDIWGYTPFSFLLSPTGKLLIERAISICIVISIALGTTRVGNSLLTRYLTRVKATDDEAQLQKLARFKTIHSVSRNVLRIVVWTPAILLIAIELGVNILPLITTIGILSAGLTFGAQSLVKDFVTGFFMLLENSFAVGDLVLINGQLGRIESLTVRVVRLRSSDGALHTFPYGNIASLSNQSRDYSAAIILFQVGFKADLTKVFEILEHIARDLRRDPMIRGLMVGPIKIDGVNAISDNAVEIRAVMRTRPGEYDKVRWAFNRLLKQYLESEKIPAPIAREICLNYTKEN